VRAVCNLGWTLLVEEADRGVLAQLAGVDRDRLLDDLAERVYAPPPSSREAKRERMETVARLKGKVS
jgi:hypothetical protein